MAGPSWHEALDAAMSETFEGMAFTEVVRCEAGAAVALGSAPPRLGSGAAGGAAASSDAVDGSVWARIAIVEPPVGELVLSVDRALAARLEEAVTGAQGGGDEGLLDVLGEVLNAIAGRLARRLDPGAERIVLGLPRTGRGPTAGQGLEAPTVYTAEGQGLIHVARTAV